MFSSSLEKVIKFASVIICVVRLVSHKNMLCSAL